MVRIDEGGGDTKGGDRLHQSITTFFEADWKLWGYESTGKKEFFFLSKYGIFSSNQKMISFSLFTSWLG